MEPLAPDAREKLISLPKIGPFASRLARVFAKWDIFNYGISTSNNIEIVVRSTANTVEPSEDE
jgi:hypothetical protein